MLFLLFQGAGGIAKTRFGTVSSWWFLWPRGRTENRFTLFLAALRRSDRSLRSRPKSAVADFVEQGFFVSLLRPLKRARKGPEGAISLA